MLTWIKNNKLATAGIAIVLIYAIGVLITKKWNPMNWFSATSPQTRATYDTARCCRADNPCGWTRATYEAQCNQ